MIDPAAGQRFTGQSAGITLKSADNLRFFSGTRPVRVLVEDVRAGGEVVFNLAGRRIRALTTVPLRKGEWYGVRLSQDQGRIRVKVDFHPPHEVPAGELIRATGLPENPASLAVVRAFLSSGLPLLPERLLSAYRRVQAVLRRSGRNTREVARLDALLSAKGLPMDAELLAAVAGVADGRSGGGRSFRDRTRQETPSGDTERAPTVDDVKKSISFADHASHPVHLFNHIVGGGDHWVIIPIRVPGDRLRATLRLLVRREYALRGSSPTNPVSYGTLVVSSDSGGWVFGLRPTGDTVQMSLLSKSGSLVGNPDLSALALHLRRFGIALDRDEGSTAGEDGFSYGGGADIMTSVDDTA